MTQGHGDQRGRRHQARERHAGDAGPREARADRQGDHDRRRRRRRARTRSRAGSGRSRRRSRRPPRTTTARSCRSVWPSSPAAWRSSASAARPRPRSRSARIASTTRCTRPGPRSRKASSPVAAWRCSTRSRRSTASSRPMATSGSASTWCARRVGPGAADRRQCRQRRRGHCRQAAREHRRQVGLRRPGRRVRRSGRQGHHRPDQGRAHRPAACGLGRGPAGDHRGHGRRAPQGRRRPRRPRPLRRRPAARFAGPRAGCRVSRRSPPASPPRRCRRTPPAAMR